MSADAEMLAAWDRFTHNHWQAIGDSPRTDSSAADEDILSEGIAHTPAGTAAKLRYAMYCHCPEPYLEAAALGATIPNMAEKLNMEDAVVQTLWSAIQSLEAMEAADAE